CDKQYIRCSSSSPALPFGVGRGVCVVVQDYRKTGRLFELDSQIKRRHIEEVCVCRYALLRVVHKTRPPDSGGLWPCPARKLVYRSGKLIDEDSGFCDFGNNAILRKDCPVARHKRSANHTAHVETDKQLVITHRLHLYCASTPRRPRCASTRCASNKRRGGLRVN